MELNTGGFSARFCPTANNLVSLVRTGGEEYIKSAPKRPMLALYALEDDRIIEYLPGKPAAVREEEGCLLIDYDEFNGRNFRAQLLLRGQGDLLAVSAVIENREADTQIIQVLLPYIGGIVLGRTHTDDAIIYPHHAGERTLNPVRNYGCEKKDFWRASSVAFEGVYRREINYCGLASMSWMYYYDAENGLYLGSHDPRFPVTGVIAETGGDESEPWMAFAFRKHVSIRSGETYDTGEYHLRISEKDWHYGAQLYREYITPYLEKDTSPAFLQDEYALNQCYNFKRVGNIEHRFEDIPGMYQAGQAWGVRHMFIASWNRTGFDADYPEYYPDMELGSAMDFRRGLQAVREAGGFTTLYINARIFDIHSDYHSGLGEAMAVRNGRGETIHEVYGPAEFTVNCPSDKLWQDYIIDTAEFAYLAYGCDGIYLDQLASAEPLPCYSKSHCHNDSGQFNQGNISILRELLARLRRHNPKAYLMTENCGDIYSCHTWGSLTWNGADYDEFYNLFKFTFPQFVQVNMVNPRSWAEEGEVRLRAFYADMRRAVLLGSVLWMGITTVFADEHTPEAQWAKKALAFRTAIQPYLKEALYLDNAYTKDTEEGIEASSWQLCDGKRMVLAGSLPGCADKTVTCTFDSQLKQADAFDTNLEPLAVKLEGSTAELMVPGGGYACLIVG